MSSGAIHCPACKRESFLRREPVYEGFRKTGEVLSCVSCGHTFQSEADISFVASELPQIFTDADKSKKLALFTSDDASNNCRHCRHYLKNPFVQRCGLHQIEVQATDCCKDFTPKSDEDEAGDPLSKLF